VRLAVVDQLVAGGGAGRLLARLVPALRDHPGVETLTLVVPADRTAFLSEHGVDLGSVDLRILDGPSVRRNPGGIRGLRRLLDGAEAVLAGRLPDPADRRRQRRHAPIARAIADADVALFNWPFDLDPFTAPARRFAVIHDLNYLHWFGAWAIEPEQLPRWEGSLRAFAATASAVCGTGFIADEIHDHLGVPPERIHVVTWSTFARPDRVDRARIPAVAASYGLDRPYLMWAGNPLAHKNLGQVAAAFARLRAAGHDVDLVVTGIPSFLSGVARNGFVARPTAGERPDVHALGFIPGPDVDTLIAGAEILVAPSLYEAGSGPALDAWALGTPVAMSDIPPFRDQLAALGTTAAMFDPCDATHLTAVLGDLLADPERRARMAAASQAAVDAHSWSDVADRLVPVLEGTGT
jgi:glycosyltransferase involved in cell wall biosynthesis